MRLRFGLEWISLETVGNGQVHGCLKATVAPSWTARHSIRIGGYCLKSLDVLCCRASWLATPATIRLVCVQIIYGWGVTRIINGTPYVRDASGIPVRTLAHRDTPTAKTTSITNADGVGAASAGRTGRPNRGYPLAMGSARVYAST